MPVKSKIVDKNNGVIDTWSSLIIGKDILSRLKLLFSDKAFGEVKFWVIDFSAVTDFSISTEEILEVVRLDKDAHKVNSEIIIIVITEKDLRLEKSKMWEMLSFETCWEKMISNNKEQAYQFIKNRMKLKFNTTINNLLT